MILAKISDELRKWGAPRTSGDDPLDCAKYFSIGKCSPHERG